MFTRSVDPQSIRLQIASSPDMVNITVIPTIFYSRISILIFPTSYTPKMKLFCHILPRNWKWIWRRWSDNAMQSATYYSQTDRYAQHSPSRRLGSRAPRRWAIAFSPVPSPSLYSYKEQSCPGVCLTILITGKRRLLHGRLIRYTGAFFDEVDVERQSSSILNYLILIITMWYLAHTYIISSRVPALLRMWCWLSHFILPQRPELRRDYFPLGQRGPGLPPVIVSLEHLVRHNINPLKTIWQDHWLIYTPVLPWITNIRKNDTRDS